MRRCATTLESELSHPELDALLGQLRTARHPGRHLEIGTAAGGTLWRMVQIAKEHSKEPFTVVDPMNYFPNQQGLVEKNLRANGINPFDIEFRHMTSHDAFQKAHMKGEAFDFIFIDGNHKYRYITRDYQWAGLLRVGGTLALHDYAPKYPGVVIATTGFSSGTRTTER